MRLYSTKNKHKFVSLKEAVLKGLPEDNGLFMPEHIPALSPAFFSGLQQMSFVEMAFEVCQSLLGATIPPSALRDILEKSLEFDAPLNEIERQLYVLELFHGPTLAFKDFGARFMAQLMAWFIRNDRKKLRILVATSGDTGGAVANGFYNTAGIEVIILYPGGKVSELQEKQLTTLGNNITALEIKGTFDDCQAMVKQAFLDERVTQHLRITSANSINIARLIPQMFYYFRAFQQLPETGSPVAVSVPSGNFGNMTAGLMARKMGLPISLLLAATNINDVVPEYLENGIFTPRPSVSTISNAMDVGNPSNFSRMLELFAGEHESISAVVKGYRYTDEITRETIRKVYASAQYLLDPHGAVGYLALKEFLNTSPHYQGIFLETAHPAKFLDVVEPAIGNSLEVPQRLEILRTRPKHAHLLSADYRELRAFLLAMPA